MPGKPEWFYLQRAMKYQRRAEMWAWIAVAFGVVAVVLAVLNVFFWR